MRKEVDYRDARSSKRNLKLFRYLPIRELAFKSSSITTYGTIFRSKKETPFSDLYLKQKHLYQSTTHKKVARESLFKLAARGSAG